jgi:hypothetical protein
VGTDERPGLALVSLPEPTITVWFGLEYDSGDLFTLNDTTKGVLDSATYVLAGDVGTQVSADSYYVSVSRGRSRELDEFEAGTCRVSLRNFERTFDPYSAVYLTDDNGVILTDDDGEYLVAEGSIVSDLMTPGKRMTIAIYGQTIFDGTIDDWSLRYESGGGADADFSAIDGLGMLARKEFDEWTTTGGQTAGPRISAVLNRDEVAFPFTRNIGTGVSTLQADLVTWGSNVLNYIQLVSKSDNGRTYASRSNVLTFDDRHSTIGSAPLVAFADDGSGIPFTDATLDVGSELLFNRVGVDREGGTLQTSSDATSQGLYGVRTLNLGGLLMDTDAQSEDMADFLLSFYKDPTARVAGLTVNVSGLADDSERADVCRLDLGGVVSVRFQPLGIYGVIEQTSVVEGIDHSMSYAGPHIVSLRLSPVSQTGVFILDDEVSGVLDTGGVLAF